MKPRVTGRWSTYWRAYRWFVWRVDGPLHGNYREWREALGVALWLAVRR